MTPVRRRRSIAAAVAAAVVVSLTAAPSGPAAAQSGGSDGPGGFGDVAGDAYFAVPVAELASRGVFAGTECDDGFCPSAPIDRKTMSVWIVRVLDGEDPAPITESRFNDVDAASFYAPFIERMAELEVTRGCGDGSRFCPDRNVTRAEMAAFITRAYDLPEGPDPGFGDVTASEWFSDYVARLAASRVTVGCKDGTVFCPGRETTRGQMATFLHRAENRDPDVTPPYSAVDSGWRHSCAVRADRTVACWGADSQGQTDAPTGEFTAVSAGYGHSCGIRTDGTVACWGADSQGQTNAPDGEFTAVSAGQWHTCGLRTDGIVACWGDNGSGQTDAPDGEFTEISAGASHNCAMRADGAVRCWGGDWAGQTDVPAGEFTAVSAGSWHSCGIRADRTVACWGDNWAGQTDAPDGEFIDVSVSYGHSCGIRTDRTIACWGDNEHGQAEAPDDQFATASTGQRHTCGLRVDGTVACWGDNGHDLTGAPEGTYTEIVAGQGHTCGLRADGTVACWGDPASGRTYPPARRFTHMSAGTAHNCAVQTDGTVECWGNNVYGQADAPDGEFTTVSAGRWHTCGVRTNGTVACWGDNTNGQNDAPDGEFTALSASESHTCGVQADGRVRCWGDNWAGQTDAPDGEFTAVSAGRWHTCGIRADGTVACWGDNTYGQNDAPDGEFTAVSAGESHTCGIGTDRTVTCWGDSWWGQTDTPAGSFAAIATGSEHSCALSVDGAIVCWGVEAAALPAGVERFVRPGGPDPGACRPFGRLGDTTAGFPLPDWALPSTGTLRVVVVFVDFPDAAARHSTHEEAGQSLEKAERYLESLSYGKVDVELDPLHRWLRTPGGHEEYMEDGNLGLQIATGIDDVAAAAADPHVDFSRYHLMMVVMPSTHFGGGNALGTADSEEGSIATTRVNTFAKHPSDRDSSIADWSSTAAHEILHNLGLLDLYPYDGSVHQTPQAPSGRAWATNEFGAMGLKAYFLAPERDRRFAHVWRWPDGGEATGHHHTSLAREMLAWSRWQLGWLDAAQVHCVSGEQATVDLRAVAAPGNGTAMAAVPLSGTELIVIESRRQANHDLPRPYRQPDGAQTAFPGLLEEGVLVYTVDARVGSGDLPMRVAGDSGDGQVDEYPVLHTGDSVTVGGFTITVVSDDGDFHTVEIVRQG